MTIDLSHVTKGTANSEELRQKAGRRAAEPAASPTRTRAKEMGDKRGEAGITEDRTRETEGARGQEHTGAQRHSPPRPGGFVPPHVLDAVGRCEANPAEERAAAQRTLDFDVSRDAWRRLEGGGRGWGGNGSDARGDAATASAAADGGKE